jgi:hypothetical protein
MRHIGNHRYVVQGRCDRRIWPIHACDSLDEARRVLIDGKMIDGKQWAGAAIHDRRVRPMPWSGWDTIDADAAPGRAAA